MTLNLTEISKNRLLGMLTFVIIMLGFYFRLDQFFIQTLIDDEWHAVHQLLRSTPNKIFNSFGHADYSIPLTLFYWFEAHYFGLSELTMRMPALLFGLATMLFFTLFVYKHFSKYEAVLFGFLLSMSTVLTIYSHKARPYAITVFLVYFAIWAFYQYYNKSDKKILYAVLYCGTAALAVWLHIVVAFFVSAPFFLEFIRVFVKYKKQKLRKILTLTYLGIATLLVTSILILPPLLNDIASLANKSGKNTPSLQTLLGALYLMFSTKSTVIVIICSALAVIGLPRVFAKSVICINIAIGFVLTVLVIIIIQPAWIQHSATFLRYLLPIIPLFLIAITAGFYTLFELIEQRFSQNMAFYIKLVSLAMFVGLYVFNSPMFGLIKSPNSNINHSKYIFDFRDDKNKIRQHLLKRPVSNFWSTLSKSPLKFKIAVAPWYFESYNWDSPIWEGISKQLVLPGYLDGLCVNNRAGEVPNNQRFRFKNVAYLADPIDIASRNIYYIVYQKTSRFNFKNLYKNLDSCTDELINIYGKPFFEDELIMVFKPNLPRVVGDKVDKQ
ncbi:hypothetical protein MNBD_GAMMA01-1104 [hydrothermal vent metagenome]|uniref:Uncharacterized protein n=1 Tax=hydrothermal vent metagenome TaxID=652676 RepID=A0A3B0VPC7_9ZZZZ